MLTVAEALMTCPNTEQFHTIQNMALDIEKMSKSTNNESGETDSADSEGKTASTVSGVEIVGESSKSFGGEGDVVLEAKKSTVVRTRSKGKGKVISSQEW